MSEERAAYGPPPRPPESLDFEQLATRLAEATGVLSDHGRFQLLRNELRQVWNARGAADCETLDAEFIDTMNPDVQSLTRALRSLDR